MTKKQLAWECVLMTRDLVVIGGAGTTLWYGLMLLAELIHSF